MARSFVDLSQFDAAVRELSKLSGHDLKTVMTAEAGKALETAVRWTPKADPEKIKAQVLTNTRYEFAHGKSDIGHVHTTADGKEWFRPEQGEHWFLMNRWRVPFAIWVLYLRARAVDDKDLAATLERRLAEALARRGMTAATWLQIGKALGVQVKAPGFIEKAAIPDGIGTGRVTAGPDTVQISGENSSLVLVKTRTGQGIIDRALKARGKYIETSIRKGALDSMKSRTRAFPALFSP